MVFATVTMVIVLLSMLAMYSVGQLTTQKMKLQNTADAVAYSAAVVQARDLNFSAYMNRAMIANQVAVGQLVSLTGWIRNADDTYNGPFSSIATTIANLSPMGWMWTTPARVIGQAAGRAKSFMDSAGPVAVQVLDTLIKVFSLASKVYHYATLESVITTAYKVKDENDSEASFSDAGLVKSGIDLAMHIKFASSFDPTANTDGEDRFAKVVDSSSDLFYKNRTLPLPMRLTPSLIDPFRLFTPGFGPLLMLQFHSGGTVMGAGDRKSFVSADATGLFVILCFTFSFFGIPIPIPFPLPPLPSGAGAAAASGNSSPPGLEAARNAYVDHRNETNNGGDGWAAVSYGAAWFNPMTAVPYFIKAAQGPGKNMHTGAGLQPYMDIAKNVTSGNKAVSAPASDAANYNDKGPGFSVELERSSDSISTSSSPKFKIGGGAGGQLDLEDKAAAKKIRAMAKAQAYFSRPTDLFPRKSYTLVGGLSADNRTEYGSLYSPYWQAHLMPSTIIDQAIGVLPQLAGI